MLLPSLDRRNIQRRSGERRLFLDAQRSGTRRFPAPGTRCKHGLVIFALPRSSHSKPVLPLTALSRGNYSEVFLRRNTMMPRSAAAITAQTIRTIEVSIVFSPFPDKNQFGGLR